MVGPLFLWLVEKVVEISHEEKEGKTGGASCCNSQCACKGCNLRAVVRRQVNQQGQGRQLGGNHDPPTHLWSDPPPFWRAYLEAFAAISTYYPCRRKGCSANKKSEYAGGKTLPHAFQNKKSMRDASNQASTIRVKNYQ